MFKSIDSMFDIFVINKTSFSKKTIMKNSPHTLMVIFIMSLVILSFNTLSAQSNLDNVSKRVFNQDERAIGVIIPILNEVYVQKLSKVYPGINVSLTSFEHFVQMFEREFKQFSHIRSEIQSSVAGERDELTAWEDELVKFVSSVILNPLEFLESSCYKKYLENPEYFFDNNKSINN